MYFSDDENEMGVNRPNNKMHFPPLITVEIIFGRFSWDFVVKLSGIVCSNEDDDTNLDLKRVR